MTGIEIAILTMAVTILFCSITISVFILLVANCKDVIRAKDAIIQRLTDEQEDNIKSVISWQTKYIDLNDKYEALRKESALAAQAYLKSLGAE